MEQQHVAIYWDADNTSLAFIPRVRNFFAARNQTPVVSRAFGCCLTVKQVALLADTGFEPISVKPGSNAVDFTLTIRAVADRQRERRDIVAVVASDSDYIALLRHLKEQGHHTIVFGGKDAPELLRNAASEFALLEKNVTTTPHQLSVSIGIKDAITDILAMHQRAIPPTVAEVGNLLALKFPKLQRSYAGRLSRRLREIGFVLTKFCRRGVVADYFVSLP
jgi:uncharacterized protein (TIGR00288 family)